MTQPASGLKLIWNTCRSINLDPSLSSSGALTHVIGGVEYGLDVNNTPLTQTRPVLYDENDFGLAPVSY